MRDIQWGQRDTTLPPLPMYALCTSQAAFNKQCKLAKHEPVPFLSSPSSKATTHSWDYKDTRVHLICVPLKTIETHAINDVLALLAHEAVHVWQEYERYVFNDTNKACDETEAYCIQRLCMSLFHIAMRVRNKRKSAQ